ncbi:MAG: hypothetical protein V1757_02315 [Actinomycetota bacterium]
MRPMPIAASILVIAAACSGDADPTGFGCESAPPEQRTSELAGVLTLIPNPVTAGATATLDIGVDAAARGGEELVGWGASWECWNGAEWVATHLLEHGLNDPGRVVPGTPGQTTTMPAIGYRVPRVFQISIPAVPPGWYRISEQGGDVGGHLPVEVVPAR